MTLASHDIAIAVLGVLFLIGTFTPLVLSVWRGTKVGVVAAVLWGAVGYAFMEDELLGTADELGTALVVFLAPALVGVGVVAAVRRLRRSRSQPEPSS